jgi:hypothetical protein
MNKHPKTLFVLKYREAPYSDGYTVPDLWGDETRSEKKALSSGLFNSARFVQEMLNDSGLETKIVHVPDNNAIHREIVAFGADHVIIEAFWVVPEKFAELYAVCPNVKFTIRNHSETPFLANEGIAFDWALRYVTYDNVYFSCNSERSLREMRMLIKAHTHWTREQVEAKTPYLPNYYPLDDVRAKRRGKHSTKIVNIGCFGAIRPLKNHMMQAIACIEYAERHGLQLNFHVNGGRVEGGGDPILKNLRELFAKYPSYNLIEQPWRPHEEFKHLVVSKMDFVLQVSFSETFNIVAADAATMGIPIVTSAEVAWNHPSLQADPNCTRSILNGLERAASIQAFACTGYNPSYNGLLKYDRASKRIWYQYLTK